MANYERTFKSAIWNNSLFEKLTNTEKVFYLLLHTGPETSDTSVYPFTIRKMGYYVGLSVDEMVELIHKFEEYGIIEYDFENEEVLVLTYFNQNPPKGGLLYEMYRKDFAKIRNKDFIKKVAEIAKGYTVTIGFLSALDEFVEIDEDNYHIKKTIETIESVKNVQKRGRDKVNLLLRKLK